MLQHVTTSVWRIPLGMVNAYLIEHPHGPILVDCGSPGDAPRIVKALAQRHHRISDLAMVIGTHLHYDHVGSLPELQQLGAPAAVMHPIDAEATQHGVMMRHLALTPPLHLLQAQFDAQQLHLRINPPSLVQPIATHGSVLYNDLEVIHTPGHTAGHISLLWHAHSGILFAGDAFTNIWGLRRAIGHEDAQQAAQSRALLTRYTYGTAVVGHGRPIISHAQRAISQRFAEHAHTGASS